MYLKLFLLFLVPLCSGLSIHFLPTPAKKFYKLSLIFGGSYLFSFMLVHLLPELFADAGHNYQNIGMYLLLGFFLQILLDFFSGGIAHGHTDTNHSTKTLHATKIIPLLIALCIHALLDGILLDLSTPHASHHHLHNHSLLIGILLHKIPIAITLAMLLNRMTHSKATVFTCLLLFALASPIGLLFAHLLQSQAIFSSHASLTTRALAIGSLLHIVTTILFESSPQHHFHAQQLIALLAGGIIAIITTLV